MRTASDNILFHEKLLIRSECSTMFSRCCESFYKEFCEFHIDDERYLSHDRTCTDHIATPLFLAEIMTRRVDDEREYSLIDEVENIIFS